jgi:hypothetical protein
MSSNTISSRLVALLLLLSLLASFFGAGFSYDSFVTPRSARGAFEQISGDSWVADGAQMSFSNLAPFGNRLTLDFNPWRPAGKANAQMVLSVCGEQAGVFEVTEQKRTISLAGSCSPRVVKIDVLNPFVPSETDRRKLGAQLRSVSISSALGVPVVDFYTILTLFSFITSLTILSALVFGRGGAAALALTVPFAAFMILRASPYLEFQNAFYLWTLFSGLLAGALVAAATFTKPSRVASSFNSNQQQDISAWVAGLMLLVVLAVGAALRIYGLGFGLPANYHPDEVPKMLAIMRMVDHGDLNPRYFLHPSLLLYSTYFVNYLMHSFFDVSQTFRETIFISGRIVSVTAGILSIGLVYFIGRFALSRMAGLFGATALAIIPLHVTSSRYLKEDSLLLFFILLCTLFTVMAVKRDRRWLLLFAGIFGGCAAATKYSGVLTILIIGAAPWLKSRSFLPDKRFFVAAFCAGAILPLSFMACTPYSVLDSVKFLKDFNSERNHMTRGHTHSIDAWSQLWMYHFSRSIFPGMTWPTTLLAVFGTGLLLWRRRVEDLFIVALILLFYLPAEFVKAKPAPQPERYIFPCLPFLALAGGEFLRHISFSRLKLFVPLVLVAVVAIPTWRTTELASEIPVDTRDKMSSWMIENLPHGSKIYMDWKPYSPRFWHDEFEINYIQRARIIPRLDVRALKESGQDYLVLSSLFYGRYFTEPKSDAAIRQRFREVFSRVPIVKQFAPKHGTYGFHNPVVTLFSLKQQDFAKLEDELARKSRGELEETTNDVRAQFRW